MARESHFESEDAPTGIVDVLLFPFRLIWGTLVFMIFAWTTSRSGRAFIFAIPAMAGITICVAVIWVAEYKGEKKAKLLSAYLMERAMTPGDPFFDKKAAVLFGKKSVDLSPEDKSLKFSLGEAYALNENSDKAFEVMNWLAESGDADSDPPSTGFSEAHRWLSQYFSTSEDIELDEKQRERLSRQQMELAYSSDNSSVEAVLGVAAIHQADAERLRNEAKKLREEGDTELAAEKDKQADESIKLTVRYLNDSIDLDLSTPGQLYATIALMKILLDEGNEEDAALTGSKFINRYETSATNNPDALPYWYSIIQACILMKDYDRANRYNERAFQLARSEQVRSVLEQFRALIEVERSRSFEDMDDETQFTARLYSVCTASVSYVRSLAAYEEMLYFVDGFSKGSDQEHWLRDAVLGNFGDADVNINPRIPGMIHVLIGFREIIQANAKEGRKHWEIAGQQHSLAPVAVNFLIQVYDRDRDLNKAKRVHLISTAIKQFPQSPYFYETRGRFLKDEGDFAPAIEDFEFALARMPGNISLLKQLAECYRETNNAEKLEATEEQIRVLEEEQLRLQNEGPGTFYSEPGESEE